MSDPNHNAVPPGSYWDMDDQERLDNEDEELCKSWADAVIDAAIEESIMRRREEKGI